jgi:hypothetical protein
VRWRSRRSSSPVLHPRLSAPCSTRSPARTRPRQPPALRGLHSRTPPAAGYGLTLCSTRRQPTTTSTRARGPDQEYQGLGAADVFALLRDLPVLLWNASVDELDVRRPCANPLCSPIFPNHLMLAINDQIRTGRRLPELRHRQREPSPRHFLARLRRPGGLGQPTRSTSTQPTSPPRRSSDGPLTVTLPGCGGSIPRLIWASLRSASVGPGRPVRTGRGHPSNRSSPQVDARKAVVKYDGDPAGSPSLIPTTHPRPG